MKERISINRFANRHKVRVALEWVDKRPDKASDMPPGSSHYRFVLKAHGKQYTGYWSQGPAICGEPSAVDILNGVAMDAASYDNARSFDEFASDLGYFPLNSQADYQRAQAAYEGCKKALAALERIFGAATAQQVMYDVEGL